MNLIYVCLFLVGIPMVTSVSPRSAIHTIFIDPSEDPFLDPYIEKITHMSIKDIAAMPKMTDHQFLQFLHNDKALVTRRSTVPVDTSIFDPLRDTQLERQTDIDKEWETLMVSGPIVVGYMGNLMVLASKQDFPFQAPAEYQYRYIRYPNSFRATLTQVSSDMYNALMSSHTAMDQIQLAIRQVPTHVKTAMKLISSASDAMLKSMLPLTLQSIGRLATESATVANSTLHRFNLLQDLLGEIIELSANTHSANEVDIERMNQQKQNATFEQQRIKESLDTIKNQYNQSRANLVDARQKYADAMKSLQTVSDPQIVSEGSSLVERLVTSAIIAVFDPVAGIGCFLGDCGGSPKQRVDNTKFENALKIATMAKSTLEEAERIHNSHFQLQLAQQNDLAKTISEMALLDFSVLSTEEIVRLLLEATEQIDLIREQWTRMIIFFSKLAAQAHSTQQVVVHDFVNVIQQAQKDNLLVSPMEREFFVEILVPAATTIESGAHLLFTMAKTYYAVSSEYMINQIAGIGKMLLIQTDEERSAQLRLVSNTTLTTSMKITELAQERHALYLEQTHTRQAEYTAYIESLTNLNLEDLSA